jgi:hypothetical protein
LYIFASALRGLLASPTLTFAPFQPAPIWYQLYLPLMLFQVIGIVQASINLFRPDWVQFHAAVQVGLEIAVLIVLGVLLAEGNWVVLLDTAGSSVDKLQEILKYINQYFFYGLLISGAVSIVQLVLKTRHLIRMRNQA